MRRFSAPLANISHFSVSGSAIRSPEIDSNWDYDGTIPVSHSCRGRLSSNGNMKDGIEWEWSAEKINLTTGVLSFLLKTEPPKPVHPKFL